MNAQMLMMVLTAALVAMGLAMTNEVSLSCSLQAAKNSASLNLSLSALDDISGSVIYSNVQNIGTSAEAIDFGETPPTLNWVLFKNLDATNYVEIGTENTVTTGKFTKIKAGKGAMFPAAAGVTYYAKANTAAILLEVGATEA